MSKVRVGAVEQSEGIKCTATASIRLGPVGLIAAESQRLGNMVLHVLQDTLSVVRLVDLVPLTFAAGNICHSPRIHSVRTRLYLLLPGGVVTV